MLNSKTTKFVPVGCLPIRQTSIIPFKGRAKSNPVSMVNLVVSAPMHFPIYDIQSRVICTQDARGKQNKLTGPCETLSSQWAGGAQF